MSLGHLCRVEEKKKKTRMDQPKPITQTLLFGFFSLIQSGLVWKLKKQICRFSLDFSDICFDTNRNRPIYTSLITRATRVW